MKRILSIALLLSALAGTAWAQSNVQAQNGGYVNAKTGDNVNSSGHVLVHQTNAAYLRYMTPTSVYTDTMASTAGGDTVSLGDLSGYRQVYILVQTSLNKNPGGWNKYAVNFRYQLGGASDSTSLFTMPVALRAVGDSTFLSSAASVYWPSYGTGPSATAAGRGECVMTLVTTGSAGLAGSKSLPQGQMFLLELPGGNPVFPAGTVTMRIRRIAQAIANSTTTAGNPRPPKLNIWVLGTAL